MAKGKQINYDGIMTAISSMMESYNFGETVSFTKLEDRFKFGRTLLPMLQEMGIIIKEGKGKYRITKRIDRGIIKEAYAKVREKYAKQKPPVIPPVPPKPIPIGGLFAKTITVSIPKELESEVQIIIKYV